nr:phage terminase small subunit [Brevundimonas sp. A19_0]
MLQLQEDQRRLKEIQSIERKIALKAELLPGYAGWIDGMIKAGKASASPLDQVFTALMAWRIDTGDIKGAMPMIEHALLNGLAMPDRFKRETPAFVVEQVSEAAIRAYEAGEDAARAFPAAVLPAIEDLIDLVDADIHDEITAKLHRALGMAILAGAKEDDADDLTARQGQALRCYQRALQLDEKVGVKKPITQLQSALKKAGALPENSPEAQTPPEQGGAGA